MYSYLFWVAALTQSALADLTALRRTYLSPSSPHRTASSTPLPTTRPPRLIDVGTGASAVFPLYMARAYGWVGVATELDPESVWYARKNIRENSEEREIPESYTPGVFEDYPHLSSCLPLPPFHPAFGVLQSPSPQHFLEQVVPTYPSALPLGSALGAGDEQVQLLRAEAMRPLDRKSVV